MRRLSVRLSLCGVGLVMATALVLLSVPARAAEASPARIADLTYDVYLGGLHIFTFDVNMALQPGRYRVTAAGGTRGMIGFLYHWDMKLSAEGLDDDGGIEPRHYAVETNWQRNPRTVDLRFAEGGHYELQQNPPPEPDPDIEGGLPETLPDGTVDPLSLAIAASRTLAESGRCDQTLPVFDGRRRFDLIVKQVDETILAPNGFSIYQGAAVRCSFSMKRISGFRKSWKSSRQWDSGSSTPPTIWLAAIGPSLLPVPVRYEGQIALGTIVVHLTKAQVR